MSALPFPPRLLSKMVSDMRPGPKVEVGVAGREKGIALAFGQLPSPRREAPLDNQGSQEGSTDPSKLGLTLAPAAQTAKPPAGGVTKVRIAAERGLQAGDIILDVTGNSVSAPLDVQRALNDAHSRSKHTVAARVKSATLPASLQSLWAKQRG